MAREMVEVQVQIPLNAYTDETGNTGLNLFDQGQPFFSTGTRGDPWR
jgi:hypothetical protein